MCVNHLLLVRSLRVMHWCSLHHGGSLAAHQLVDPRRVELDTVRLAGSIAVRGHRLKWHMWRRVARLQSTAVVDVLAHFAGACWRPCLFIQ